MVLGALYSHISTLLCNYYYIVHICVQNQVFVSSGTKFPLASVVQIQSAVQNAGADMDRKGRRGNITQVVVIQ